MDTKTLINTAKENLDKTNEEIISASHKKIKFACASLFIAVIALLLSIFLYDRTLTANLDVNANYWLLSNSFNIKSEELSNYEKQLEKIKKDCDLATDSFNIEIQFRGNATRTSNNNYNIGNYHKKEHEKDKKCGSVEEYNNKINNTKKDIKEIITVLTNLKNGLMPVYFFLLLGVIFLLVFVFSFISFINSRQKSLSIRLMINQYHAFHLAAIQCDKLKADEVDPEKLINEVIKKILVKVTGSKKQKKNSELYTLLGKLKVPQRKSVEARAELIKVISTYHENNH